MIKKVGNLWNDKEIEIYIINNKKIALNGWNGEAFCECWEVADNDGLQLINVNKSYIIKPVYDENLDIVDLDIE